MLKILYSSVTGNTERTCEYIAGILKELKPDLKVELQRSEEVDITYFNTDDTFIVATSTWNMGQMNQFFQHIYDRMPSSDMTDMKLIFLGLGDIVYGDENFCKGMLDIREASLKAGATELGEALMIDGDVDSQMDTIVKTWVNSIVEFL